MKKLFLSAAVLLAVTVCAAVFIMGCAPKQRQEAAPSPSASAEPTQRPTDRPTAAPSATAAASPEASPEASMTPAGSEGAGDPVSGSIDGFMEGGVVDPEDAPEIAAIFTDGAEYAGMAIQSMTYKLHEGRQAYYVILQGVGVEDRAFYVYADRSVVPADKMPGD